MRSFCVLYRLAVDRCIIGYLSRFTQIKASEYIIFEIYRTFLTINWYFFLLIDSFLFLIIAKQLLFNDIIIFVLEILCDSVSDLISSICTRITDITVQCISISSIFLDFSFISSLTYCQIVLLAFLSSFLVPITKKSLT